MLSDGLTLIGDSAISRELISRRGAAFPGSPANADLFQLTETLNGQAPGIYSYSTGQATWVAQTDSERDPYDMSVSIIGRPKPDAVVAQAIAVRTSIILGSFDKSRAVAQVVATSSAEFSISILDADGDPLQNLGTVTFGANQRFGVFASTSSDPVLLQPGEILSVKAPVVRDATLKEISVTIAGRLAVLSS